jgi:hypothetical protein
MLFRRKGTGDDSPSGVTVPQPEPMSPQQIREHLREQGVPWRAAMKLGTSVEMWGPLCDGDWHVDRVPRTLGLFTIGKCDCS